MGGGYRVTCFVCSNMNRSSNSWLWVDDRKESQGDLMPHGWI